MDQREKIKAIRDEIHQRLDGMVLNVDDAYSEEEDRYSDDGTTAYRWAVGEIYKALRAHLADAQRQLSENRPLASLTTLLGIYEGCNNLEHPRDNGYDLFDDYEQEVMQLLTRELNDLGPRLADALAANGQEKEAVDLLFSQARYYETEPESRSFPMLYDFQQLEPLLLPLLRNEEMARYLLSQLDEEERREELLAGAVLRAAELTGEAELWREVAYEHAPENARIAEQLLTFLHTQGDEAAFLHAARSLFSKHPAHLSGYLLDHLSQEREPAFFRDVLIWHTRHHGSIEHYRQLRGSLSEEEVRQFLEERSHDWNPRFYASVLAEEGQYAKLLRTARFQVHSRDLIHYLRLLAPTHPAETLDLIRQQIHQQLPRERGADFYRLLAIELALFRELPAPWPAEAAAVAAQLHRDFPLRTELHEALQTEGFGMEP